MQRDRWKEINRIFHAALDISPQDRPGFVAIESKDDPDLQSQVERLLHADQLAEDYLESPLVPPEAFNAAFNAAFSDHPQLRTGDILCQRFHILRAVGSGGMGQVYEAHDTELAVNVALKLIRPEIAANPQALARFRQEVRLARRITHPNVCRTYDLERDTLPTPGGPPRTLVFLTMEFLPGETLAERLKRTGPLTLDETLNIARQIAAALDAAHALGIVHRDIKPGNIMLVPPGDHSRPPARPSPRVVITDFGLARLDPVSSQDEQALTQHSSHSNQPIGTPPYMAPEQLEGRAVSAATDIYAFGLLLFEMATGQRAFPSTNLLTGIAQRLNGPPPSARALQSNLPDSLEQAIQGCLRRNPEDRFPTAQAVVDCLTGQSTPPEIATIPTNNPPPISNQRFYTRRALVLAAILPVAVSLFLLGLRFSWWKGNPVVAAGALVYLAPVQNETGDKSLDNITELLQAGLGQSSQINLLDQSQVGDTLQRMTKAPNTVIDEPLAREVAMRTGAVRVIFATVTGTAGSYQLNIDIQLPDSNGPLRTRDHWNQTFKWTATGSTVVAGAIPQKLLNTVRDSTDWIRANVGESRHDIARLDVPPEDVTTGSWAALEAYGHGEELSQARRKEDAAVALRRAVAIDPEFATAYARLGDIEISLGRGKDGYLDYERAMRTGLDRRLTRRETDRIKGIYASDSWDYDAAQEAFRDYTVFYPNDFRGWFYRALPLMRLGRYPEAVASLDQVEKLLPRNIFSPFDEGICALQRGDVSAAKMWAERLRNRGDAEPSRELAGIAAFLSGDISAALNEIDPVRQADIPAFRLQGYSLIARLWAEKGDTARAFEAVRGGQAEASAQGSSSARARFLTDEASLLCKQSEWSPCTERINLAIALDDSPDMLLDSGELLGRALERAPFAAKALLRRTLDDVAHRVPTMTNNRAYELTAIRLHAEQSAAAGKMAEALNEARRAVSLDQQYRRREQLVRFLIAAAAIESTHRQPLREEARRALATTVFNPTTVWLQPQLYRPGAWSEDAQLYRREFAPTGFGSPPPTKLLDSPAFKMSAPSHPQQ